MSSDPATLVLVEDDAIVCEWIRLALEGSEFTIAAIAAIAAGTIELVRRLNPDLVLVDYRLPDQLGTELIRGLRRAGLHMPAVLMTAGREEGFNEAARHVGAQGTMLKTGSADELLTTLRRTRGGTETFDLRHPTGTAGPALSPREREVLILVAGGQTNVQVAAALGIGRETVKTLLARIFLKLGARNRAEAVNAAYRFDLL